MKMDTILDWKKERDGKTGYSPSGIEGDYVNELKSLWQRDYLNSRKSYRYFNDRDLVSYMDLNERDSFLYVGPKKLDNWRSRTRRQTPREKANAVVAAILDQNLSPEVFAHDVYGRDMRDAADVMQSLLAFSDDVEDADEKRKLRAFELLKHGTIANEVSWTAISRQEKKIVKRFDPKTMTVEYERRNVKDLEAIWTKIIPLNRIMLADATKYFIEEQPHLWKEYVVSYEEAYAVFYEWKNWVHVMPWTADQDDWNDTEMQLDTEVETSGERNTARIRVYENRWRDEYAVTVNGVLMTPPGMPLLRGDKQYDIALTQLELFSSQFAYGRSFFHVLHNDGIILDFLYNSLVDKARQGLEPPLVSSFKNMLNKNIFAPGKISQGDVNFKRLVDHVGVTSADIEIARFVEENMNKSSVSPIFQGQSQRGGQTAYEIREQQKSALRVLGLVLYSIARMESDIARLKAPLIWEHYPEIKNPVLDKKTRKVVDQIKTFVVRGNQAGSTGIGRKEISFGKMPETGEATMKAAMEMIDYEDGEKRRGETVKKYIVDPEVLSGFRYLFKVVANPSQRKSKIADAAEAKEKYNLYVANPLIDPEWTTRLLLRSYGDEEEKAIKKQAAPPAPQAPGAGPGGPEVSLGGFGATETTQMAKEAAMNA